MNFLNEKHHARLKHLLEKDLTHEKDIERKSLFYIIAGNDDLYSKKNHIYDCINKWINVECLNFPTVDFSTSSKALIRLGFNLYNNYTDEKTTPTDILYSLDSKNYNLAMNAINIRFGMSIVKESEFGVGIESEIDVEEFIDEDEWDIEM